MEPLVEMLIAGIPNFAGFVLLAYVLNGFLNRLLDLLTAVVMALIKDDAAQAQRYLDRARNGK